MNRIIVDTSVWSLAFRKKNLDESQRKTVATLSEYIRAGKIVMLGVIRQETLSGISDYERYKKIARHIAFLP